VAVSNLADLVASRVDHLVDAARSGRGGICDQCFRSARLMMKALLTRSGLIVALLLPLLGGDQSLTASGLHTVPARSSI
jgi:hypothetical protein